MKKTLLLFLLTALSGFQGLFAQQFCRTNDRANFTSTKNTGAHPKVKWTFKTGAQVASSPVLFENMLLIGSSDGYMYALDQQNGKEMWKFKTGGAVKSSVAIEEGAAFFISGDGIFYALDARSGKLKWKFTTGGEKTVDTWDYYQSSACVQNGSVYFGCADGFVYALSVANGQLKWKYKTGGPVHAAPTMSADALFIGGFDGFFYCLNLDGTLRWKYDTMGELYFPTGEVQYHAVVSDTTVYFCSRDYNAYALNVHTGIGHWVFHEVGSWTSVPSLAGRRLIVTTSDAHKVLCFGKSYGYKVLEAPVALNVYGSASISDSLAYIGCLDGKLYRMNVLSGAMEVLFQTESSKANYPKIFDPGTGKFKPDLEQIYNNDVVRIYDAFLSLGSILSTPWIDQGVVYFGSADGNVYALE